jgi:outer membrane protein assembly factor BamA
MRLYSLGFLFLLFCGLLAAQTPANQIGQVTVASVDVAPGSSVSPEHLHAVAEEIQSHSYPAKHFTDEITERARYTLQRDGFFQAQVRVSSTRTLRPDQSNIAVTLAIREGRQFRLSQITFTGNTAALTSELRSQFAIANGDIFDTDKIRQGLEGMRRLYMTRGYVNFAPKPNTSTDDGTSTVSLKIDVDEGKQFHFGALTVEGHELHPGDRQKLLSAWAPIEGDIYNWELIAQFWKNVAHLLPPGWQPEQHVQVHEDAQASIADLKIVLPETN